MLELKNISKTYTSKAGVNVRALREVNLTFGNQGLVFIRGKSGSGKSTLLNIIGAIDNYDSGEIIINGCSSKSFTERDFDSYRNTFIGFVFQEFNLLEDYSVGKNIETALELQKKPINEETVEKILKTVGLENYAKRKINELSGGQKQRVAIVRALIKEPQIILADEPTGSLDSENSMQIFEMLKEISKDKLVIVVSHEREIAEIYADRIVDIENGKIISDKQKAIDDLKNVNIINEKLIHIKRGYQLTPRDIGEINKVLVNGDFFITDNADQITNFKKRLEDNQKKSALASSAAVEKQHEHYGNKDRMFIKSRLPFKTSFRMGTDGLKLKKVRLFFTVFLATLSLLFFGLSATAMAFDSNLTEIKSLEKYDKSTMLVKKEKLSYTTDRGSFWETDFFTEDDLAKIDSYNNIRTFKVVPETLANKRGINIRGQIINYKLLLEYNYYASSIDYIVEINSPEDLGLVSAAEGSRMAQSFTEIIITDYIADILLDLRLTSAYNAQSYSDLLNKKLDTHYGTLTIVGVYKTEIDLKDYEPYKELDFTKANELDAAKIQGLKDSILAMTFVKNGFTQSIQDMILRGYSLTDNDVITTRQTTKDYTLSGVTNPPSLYSKYDASDPIQNNNIVWLKGAALEELQENQIVIDARSFTKAIEWAEISNSEELKCEFGRHYANSITYESGIANGTELEIVGIFFVPELPPGVTYPSRIFVSNQFFQKIESSRLTADTILIKLNGSSRQNLNFLRNLSESTQDFGYTQLRLKYFTELTVYINFPDYIFDYVISGLAIASLVLGFFATLLLINFISVNIAAKKKEIGTLRAMGARRTDVFKIFLCESLTIGTINFLLSTIMLFIASAILTNILKARVLIPRLSQVMLIAAVCYAISTIATFISVRKIANKKPVDAINNR